MRRHFFAAIFSVALIVAVASSFSGYASADAAQGGLSISPTSYDIGVKPGSTYTGTILVLNQGTTAFSYTIYASPYNVTGEDYTPVFTAEPNAPSVNKWFSFGITDGSLNPGAQTNVPYTLTIPTGTPAGSYYAVAFAQTSAPKGAGSITIQKRVGTIFYLRVAGPASLKGNIVSWSVPWLQNYPLTAMLRMGNTGTLNYKANVNITFSDIFGGTKYQFNRDPEILPEKIREIPVPWQDGARFGLFKVSGTVQYNGITSRLATRYVFIASGFMRLATVGIFVVFVAAVVVMGRRRATRK